VPAGGYFGTKKATEPIHVQYSYDDNSVAVVNSTYEAVQAVKVSAKLYNLDAKEKGAREGTMNVAPDSSTKAFDLPKVADLTKTYFLRLQLQDASGKLLSDNFYWLSTKPDVLDWKHKKDTVYTPQAEFGDLTGLNSLPQTKLDVTSAKEAVGGKAGVGVTLRNPGPSIAFMVHLRMTRGKGGEDLTPIFWSDNYFSLLPGEQKRVTATYDPSDLEGKAPILHVDGYNVTAQTSELP
jgi:exo-1,4-beta-D-glucosaminidase